jgi:glycosyltransferase involved in cell wall biosynthesis
VNAPLTGPSLLALVGDHGGSSLWRVLQPVTALQARGYPCEWDRTTAKIAEAISMRFEGLLLPRLSWPPEQHGLAAAWLAEHQAAGRFVVYDCDDDLFTAEAMHREREVWKRDVPFDQLEAERYERIWALSVADGVTVSTPHLARIVGSYTDRPILVVPNAIDVRSFRAVVRATRRQHAGLTIGWAGGRRPDADLTSMAKAWGRVAATCPEVTFVLQGHRPAVVAEQVPPDRLVLLPWMSVERYPAGLAEVDIACCAVEATRWNQNKTPIKAYEAAVAGSAVVATPAVYGAVVEHGQTGYLAETADEWEAALLALVCRPSLRSMLARRLLRQVEKRHSLERELWRWPAAWAAIQEDASARRRVIAV